MTGRPADDNTDESNPTSAAPTTGKEPTTVHVHNSFEGPIDARGANFGIAFSHLTGPGLDPDSGGEAPLPGPVRNVFFGSVVVTDDPNDFDAPRDIVNHF